MFRLILVDDEPTIRKGLALLIPWSALNIELVGEAADGAEALALVEQLQPDIIITDIRMPRMDGLELTRTLTDRRNAAEVIILTGYADFSYAQSAVRYGVADYLLKPTSRDHVVAAVKRAQQRILEGRRLAITDELPQLQMLFLEQVTRRLTGDVCLSQRMETLGIALTDYRLAAFQFEEHASGSKQRNLLALKNIVSSVNPDGYTYFYGDTTVLAIFPLAAGQEPEAIATQCREVSTVLEQFTEACVSVAISAAHTGIQELSQAAEEAMHTLTRQFYTEESLSVYQQPDMPVYAGDSSATTLLSTMESLLESYDFDRARQHIHDFFLLQRSCAEQPQNAIHLCLQLRLLCQRVLDRNGRPPLEETLQDALAQCGSFSKLEQLVEDMLHHTEKLLRYREAVLSPAVQSAVDYIDQNFQNPLFLRDIADHVFLNVHHLCRVFKRERGETINEYITKTRINAAKRLLCDGSILLYEVAERVGYNDPAYFSAVFKKMTGQSPKSYQGIEGHP